MAGTQKLRRTEKIVALESHAEPFVTVRALAEYWLVSRRHIRKQIADGLLPAVGLGPRSFRIRTLDAIEFERRARTSIRTTRPTQSSSGVAILHQTGHRRNLGR